MDRLIRRFDFERDQDLNLCEHRGVAYQQSMKAGRVAYDHDYLEKCRAYEGGDIARAVNHGRCDLIARHDDGMNTLLDVGSGTGAFMRDAETRLGVQARGFDVIPEVVAQLEADGRFSNDFGSADIVTLWDSIEHMDTPEIVLKRVRKGALLFASLPVFKKLKNVRESKHYRPGEHLYYWTPKGFIDWMAFYGYRLLEESDHETHAGREGIGAFAFCRDLPDYNDHIEAYQQIHSSRHYGDSATEFHLADATRLVKGIHPGSILDYGCGRSDLLAHFWDDGRRKLARYDPAIARFRDMPPGRFDLTFCCDVLEHIPMAAVDRVLLEVKEKSPVALFTISTKPAKALLPDGRNAHVTLLTKSEWKRWVSDVFGTAQEFTSRWEHQLVLAAGIRRAV